MKIRIIALVVTLLLGGAGFALVTSYVHNADARALADQEAREVYLVNTPIPKGTPVEEFGDYVNLQTVPAATVPDESVASLEDQKGKVAAVNLEPGEQVLGSRLVEPQALEAPGTVPVPKGFQELTLTLGPDKVVGGQIKAGDKVGVYLTFEEDRDGKEKTAQRMSKVLVTAVQGAPVSDGTAETTEEESGTDAPAVPEGSMLVTFAVNAAVAEDFIFANSFGDVHLTLEDKNSIENADGARIEDF